MSLPIDWLSPSVLITLLDHLAKSAVTGIGVRRIKLGAIEEIEIIHAQDTCEVLAEIEVLEYGGVLVVEARTAQFWIVSYGVAEDILRGGEGKTCRVEHLGYAGLSREVGLSPAVRCGAEWHTANPVWTQYHIWSRCRFSRIGIAILLDLALIAIAQWLTCLIVEDPGNLPPA